MLCERCMILHADEKPRKVSMLFDNESEMFWPGLCGRCSIELFKGAPGMKKEYKPALKIVNGKK